MNPSDGDEAPANRWATTADLAAVETRLTRKIDEMRGRGWQLATLAMAGVAVLATLLPHIDIR